MAKLNKEKKHQEEVNRKLTEDLQAEEDKMNQLNKTKYKVEQNLDGVSFDAFATTARHKRKLEVL